jgi:hypothetical protein
MDSLAERLPGKKTEKTEAPPQPGSDLFVLDVMIAERSDT